MVDLQQKLKDEVAALVVAYSEITGRSTSAVGAMAVGDTSLLSRMREEGRGITARRYDRILQWFSVNWPAGAQWPEGIERPETSLDDKAYHALMERWMTRVVALRETGMPVWKIAIRLGLSDLQVRTVLTTYEQINNEIQISPDKNDDAKIVEMWKAGVSVAEIARQEQATEREIHNRLKNFERRFERRLGSLGLKKFPHRAMIDAIAADARIAAMRDGGMSGSQIARQEGVTPQVISKRLARHATRQKALEMEIIKRLKRVAAARCA